MEGTKPVLFLWESPHGVTFEVRRAGPKKWYLTRNNFTIVVESDDLELWKYHEEHAEWFNMPHPTIFDYLTDDEKRFLLTGQPCTT